MYYLIKRYQSGGKLDTEAMRKDIKSDERFFKDGVYTSKGKRRLAAVQQIEDTQKKGLLYKINEEEGTFSIEGSNADKAEGKGLRTDENTIAFLNKNKRARKEVSKALVNAKYQKEAENKDANANQNKTASASSTTDGASTVNQGTVVKPTSSATAVVADAPKDKKKIALSPTDKGNGGGNGGGSGDGSADPVEVEEGDDAANIIKEIPALAALNDQWKPWAQGVQEDIEKLSRSSNTLTSYDPEIAKVRNVLENRIVQYEKELKLRAQGGAGNPLFSKVSTNTLKKGLAITKDEIKNHYITDLNRTFAPISQLLKDKMAHLDTFIVDAPAGQEEAESSKEARKAKVALEHFYRENADKKFKTEKAIESGEGMNAFHTMLGFDPASKDSPLSGAYSYNPDTKVVELFKRGVNQEVEDEAIKAVDLEMEDGDVDSVLSNMSAALAQMQYDPRKNIVAADRDRIAELSGKIWEAENSYFTDGYSAEEEEELNTLLAKYKGIARSRFMSESELRDIWNTNENKINYTKPLDPSKFTTDEMIKRLFTDNADNKVMTISPTESTKDLLDKIFSGSFRKGGKLIPKAAAGIKMPVVKNSNVPYDLGKPRLKMENPLDTPQPGSSIPIAHEYTLTPPVFSVDKFLINKPWVNKPSLPSFEFQETPVDFDPSSDTKLRSFAKAAPMSFDFKPMFEVKEPLQQQGDQQVLEDSWLKKLFKKPKMLRQTGNEEDTDPGIALFSRTGINTPVGEVQYNDIAQLALALRAKNKKIADVPVRLDKFASQGSRNVLAARDIDAGMLNEANKAISAMGTRYQGSDPVMSLVSSKINNKNMATERGKLIANRAQYRRSEEDRVANEMETKRQQEVANLQNETAVRNLNNQRLGQADLARAQAEQQRDAQFYQTLGTLFNKMEARAVTSAADRRNALAQQSAAKYQADKEAKKDVYLQEKMDYDYLRYKQGVTPEELKEAADRVAKAKADYTTSAESKDLIDEANQIDYNSRLLRRITKVFQ